MALQGDAIVLKTKDQRCSKGDVVEKLVGRSVVEIEDQNRARVRRVLYGSEDKDDKSSTERVHPVRNDKPLRTNVKKGLKTRVKAEMKPSSTSRQTSSENDKYTDSRATTSQEDFDQEWSLEFE